MTPQQHCQNDAAKTIRAARQIRRLARLLVQLRRHSNLTSHRPHPISTATAPRPFVYTVLSRSTRRAMSSVMRRRAMHSAVRQRQPSSTVGRRRAASITMRRRPTASSLKLQQQRAQFNLKMKRRPRTRNSLRTRPLSTRINQPNQWPSTRSQTNKPRHQAPRNRRLKACRTQSASTHHRA